MTTTSSGAPRGGTSEIADLDGPVHYVAYDGPPDAPAAVLVHGIGGSHLDWPPLVPYLASRLRLFALDLPGSGRSPLAGRSSSAEGGAEVVERFVRDVCGGPAILVGNSYGGLVNLVVAAGRPDLVAGVALLNATVPVQPRDGDPKLAVLLASTLVPNLPDRILAQQRAHGTVERQVLDQLALMCPGLAERDPELVAAMVKLRTEQGSDPEADRALIGTFRSCVRWLTHPGRHHRMMNRVQDPVLMLHGERDTILPVRWARAAAARNRGWRAVTLPGAGHMPQLDQPAVVAGHVHAWLDDNGLAPAAATPVSATTVDARRAGTPSLTRA